MDVELGHKPQWEIDGLLEGLINHDVRVAAESFAPANWNGKTPTYFIPTRDLVLPDNSRASGLPVYFEGRLKQFTRKIGVVYVHLESPTPLQNAIEGIVRFRGKLAVILRGPATVQLSFPFRVEPLPLDADNYWRDLQMPRIQFNLPL